MNKKILYSLTFITLLVILIIMIINIKTNNEKDNTFSAEKLNPNSNSFKKINDKASNFIGANGVYLLETEKDNITYLILDGSHVNLKNEIPYFTDVKVENIKNTITIYFTEELKIYSTSKYPEIRLIYKITMDQDYEYIKVFKNGKATHFDAIICS